MAHFWLPDTRLSTLGVRLFFVLSGFLLTGILLRERNDAARSDLPRTKVLTDFYARRVLRIWPAYYFALGCAVIMGAGSVAQTFPWHALFGSNILFFLEQRWFPEITAPLWTLSVEEQFYLLLPLLVLFLCARHLRPLLVVAIIVAIAYRGLVALLVQGPLDFYFVLPIAQLDALGGGALLALIQHARGPIDWKKLLAWSFPLAAILYLPLFSDRFDFSIGHAAYLLPMVALVAGAGAGIDGLAGRVLSAAPIVGLGRISYGVYLYHVFVATAADHAADALSLARPIDGPFRFLLYFVLTIAAATASWFVLERPALALRRYFRTATKDAVVIPAAPTQV